MRLRYVASLRDPMTRVLSEYRHVCGPTDGAWDYHESCYRGCKASHTGAGCDTPEAIEAFVTKEVNANGVHSRQAQMLAGVVASGGGEQSSLAMSEDELLEKAEARA